MKNIYKFFVLLFLGFFIMGQEFSFGCIDFTKPKVVVRFPSNNSTIYGIVTIIASAFDNVGISKVEFYIDGVKVGEDTSSPYEYSWDTINLPYDSKHTIQVKAYDNVGNIGESAVVTVRVGDPNIPVWQNVYGGSNFDVAYSIQQTADGGYILAGETLSFGAGLTSVYILKLNGNGEEEWDRTYGGERWNYAYSIKQTTDGGYIVTGETDSFGKGRSDFYIIKLDNEGNKVWEKVYGGSEVDYAYSIQQTTDGGYIVAGSRESFGAGEYDFYVIKLDSNGNKIWEKTYGGNLSDIAHSVQQTTDGGYIIAGSTESFGVGSSDVYVIKTDSLGNTGSNPLD